ncbi:cysteine proteinase [Aspergillus heteromorphus CBS 117.55]|uniref:Cysteine proteinase n=1 Tax=Aspergillus heteromorphus CBS 117.55 TaxID=1448321 RepID=A0A317W686_9EURO|nr:cysteine proteinase [Aspergillus heteromorphus CBS 117.55]PWY79660.1 cysteine proteinase [Aspergillus heteromorphus CBS 117.55]
MPLFDKLSEYLPLWTLPHPAGDHPPLDDSARSPPPSDAIFQPIQRTQTSGASPADSPVESGSRLPQSVESVPESTPASSNAEGLRYYREPRPVRPKYRQPFPRSESGMRRLPGEKSSHTTQLRPSELQDELRLFPPSKRNNTTQAGAAAGYIGPEQSKKRRRQDYSDTSFKKPINLSDDVERPARAPHPGAEHSSRMSPTLSHSPRKKRKQRDNRPTKVKEFRDIEDIVSPRVHRSPKRGAKACQKSPSEDEHEERFTENAAKARRKASSLLGNDAPEPDKLGKPTKHQVFESVEIVNTQLSAVGKCGAKKNRTIENPIQMETRRRTPDSRESSDELQGAVTVQIPSFSGGDLRRRVRSDSEVEEHPATGKRQPDIRPTVFESPESGPQRKQKKKSVKSSKVVLTRFFNVVFVRLGSIEQEASADEPVELDVNLTHRSISLTDEDATKSFILPFTKILSIMKGNSPSHKVRLQLSKMSGIDQRVDVEFVSARVKEEFCSFLTGQNFRIDSRDGEWLDKAFNKARRELKQSSNGMKRPAESAPDPISAKQPDSAKRVKLTDALRDAAKPSGASRECANPSITAAKPNETSQPKKSPSPSPQQLTENTVSAAAKKSKLSSDRATRAMVRRPTTATVVCDDSDDDLAQQQPLPDGQAERWHIPLVYPPSGKKKAEVTMSDLIRLGDNEFLNDNLIGFYIRFLQEHLDRTNKETAQRVYFYNSFFYHNLTNRPRGTRAINYEGVQKWTRTVDIFSHDYVVVPINENAHWYVAIICNLPSLQGIANKEPAPGGSAEVETETSVPPDSQVQEVPETPEPEVAPNQDKTEEQTPGTDSSTEKLAKQSLAFMSLEQGAEKGKGKEDPSASEEWPEQEDMPVKPPKTLSNIADTGASGLAANPRKTKTKRSGPRYDACQPIIITFDSLDLTRSPTIRCLREYLFEEAKSKRGVEIDKTLIKGMTARGIPLQPNFSDCGLYLLAYLEKFVQDPDLFIRKLLHKEMDSENDWPVLKSGLLRSRLRKFLDALYDEQELLKRQEFDPKTTMVDRKPICYLLKTSVSAAEAKREKKKSPLRKEKSPSGEAKSGSDARGSSATGSDANGRVNAKEGKSDKPRKPSPQSPTVDVKRAPTPSEPRDTNTAKQSLEPEVVLVPDSQPETTPSTTERQAPGPRPRPRSPERKPSSQTINDEEVEDSSPEDIVTAVAVPVETQVRGTPPPSAPVRPRAKQC